MIDIQKAKATDTEKVSSDKSHEQEAHREVDWFTIKRLCDEKLSVSSATRLLNNIRVWYPETDEIISKTDFNSRESIYDTIKLLRFVLLSE